MAFEKVTSDPIDAFVVLVKPTAADQFAVLGGTQNVFATKPEAIAAAVSYVAGPPSNGYLAVVLGPDQDMVFRRTA